VNEVVAMVMLALTGIAAWGVLGPYQRGGTSSLERLADPLEDERRRALRHLRDLDEDLARGKLDEDGYRASRAVAETHAVAVLRSLEAREGNGELPAAMREVRGAGGPTSRPAGKAAGKTAANKDPAPQPGRRWGRLAIGGAAAAVVVAGAVVLLTGAASNRNGGQTITGGVVDQAAQADQGGQVDPGAQGSAQAGSQAPQPPLEVFEQRVKEHPNDVAARLDLGQRYLDAGKLREATTEYLAAVKLEPGNLEANTSLGLLLFRSGLPEQGLRSVGKALASDPRYPEALYAKGLILFMGLRQPAAAADAFKAYLAAAPFGSHRDAVQQLLQLASANKPPPPQQP
jgi:cytochrome c-type biogenesis protein CcmH/NrfG